MLTIALRVTCCIGAAAVVACREPSRDDVPSSFRQEIETAELESRRAADKLQALPNELDEAGRALKTRLESDKERLDRAIMDLKRASDTSEAQHDAARRSWAEAKKDLDEAVRSFSDAWDEYERYFQQRVADVLTDEQVEHDARAVKEGTAIEIEVAFVNGVIDVDASRAAIERMIRFTNVCPTARFGVTGTAPTQEEGRRRALLIIEALRARGAPVARIVDVGGAEGDGKAIVRAVRTCT